MAEPAVTSHIKLHS